MHSNSDAVLQRLDQCICDVPCEMLAHVHVQSVTCFCRCVSDAKKGTLRLTFYLWRCRVLAIRLCFWRQKQFIFPFGVCDANYSPSVVLYMAPSAYAVLFLMPKAVVVFTVCGADSSASLVLYLAPSAYAVPFLTPKAVLCFCCLWRWFICF